MTTMLMDAVALTQRKMEGFRGLLTVPVCARFVYAIRIPTTCTPVPAVEGYGVSAATRTSCYLLVLAVCLKSMRAALRVMAHRGALARVLAQPVLL